MRKKDREPKAKTQKAKRPTRLDVVVIESVQNHGHLSSADLIRRRELLNAEVAAAEAELIEITARTTDLRVRKAKAEATLAGITQVLACRP